MSKPLTYLEIVKALVGDIAPVGSTNLDAKRFENLRDMCELVNQLVTEIDRVGHENVSSQFASMKRAGEYASDFMTKTLGIA